VIRSGSYRAAAADHRLSDRAALEQSVGRSPNWDGLASVAKADEAMMRVVMATNQPTR
jgi:hypothetical protein